MYVMLYVCICYKSGRDILSVPTSILGLNISYLKSEQPVALVCTIGVVFTDNISWVSEVFRIQILILMMKDRDENSGDPLNIHYSISVLS